MTSLVPTLSSASPSQNSGSVPVGSDIVLTFNEDMVAASGTITISDGFSQSYYDKSGQLQTRWVGATDTRVLSISDPQVSITGHTVTINLSTDLKAGLTYGMTISCGALADNGGNSYAGLADSSKLHFTTAGAAVAPTAHIGSTIQFTDTGDSASDGVTNSGDMHGTYTGTLGANDMVQVSNDGGATWHIAEAANGTWAYEGVPAVNGNTSLIARVANTHGLNSGSTSLNYTFDNVAPSVLSATISDSNLTAGETATVTVTLSEKVTSFSITDFDTNASTYTPFQTHDGGLTWTATVTPNASTNVSGVIDYFAYSATDLAGNQTPDGMFEVDSYNVNTAPPINVNAAITALSADTGKSGTDFYTRTAAQTISGTLDGDLPSGDQVQVSLDGGTTWTNAVVDNANHAWSIAATLLSGTHSIMTQVTDGVSTSTPQEHGYTLDTQPPTLQGASFSAGSVVLTFSENIDLSTDAVLTLTNGSNVIQLAVETGAATVVNGNQVVLTLSQPLSTIASYSLDMAGGTVTDQAGNIGPSGSDHLLNLATDANGNLRDESYIIASATAAFSAASTHFSGQFYSENTGIDHVQVSNGSGGWIDVTPGSGSNNVYSWSATSSLPQSVIAVRMVDSASHVLPYQDYGSGTLYFGSSGANTITELGSNSIVFGGSGTNTIAVGDSAHVFTGNAGNTSTIGNIVTAGNFASIQTGTGSNSVSVGDNATINSNGYDLFAVGANATVTLNGSGSTVNASGAGLALTTGNGSHSIDLLTAASLNVASINAGTGSDTLNFFFDNQTIALGSLSGTHHMSGVDFVDIWGTGNTITVGALSDVTALSGTHTLIITAGASAVASSNVQIDSQVWHDTGTTSGSYEVYRGIADSSISLLVLVGLPTGAP